MDGNVTFLGEFSKKLVTNTFFNFLGRCWNFILTLLLTPYILSRLDVHDFGTWVLMTIFISAFNPGQVPLFDLGGVFMKYISEYYTYEDYAGINRVLLCGMFFYGLFGIALTSGGLLLERPLFHLFHISDGASSAYFLVLVASAISNISAMLLAVFKGIQRMDKSNSLEIRLSILNAAGTIVFLRIGWGIFGLAANALLNAGLAVIVTWWALRRMIPKIRMSAHLDKTLLGDMLAYGMKMQVSSVGGLVSFQVPTLLRTVNYRAASEFKRNQASPIRSEVWRKYGSPSPRWILRSQQILSGLGDYQLRSVESRAAARMLANHRRSRGKRVALICQHPIEMLHESTQ